MQLSETRDAERGFVAVDDPLPPDDRVRRRSVAAIDELYRTQRPRLLGFLRRRTSSDNAADLVQQVFARFLAHDEEGSTPIVNSEGYLRRTARNLLYDESKVARRRSAALHVSIEDVDVHGPDQVAALEARDTLNRLEVSLLRLKPRTREIFLAHRIDGYSYGEIAARTGLSVKGVEKHMSRAIAHVDRMMSPG